MDYRYQTGEAPRYELIRHVARADATRPAAADPRRSGVEVRRVVLAGARAALDGGRGVGDAGTALAAAAFGAALGAAWLDAGDPVVRELVAAAVRCGVSAAVGPPCPSFGAAFPAG